MKVSAAVSAVVVASGNFTMYRSALNADGIPGSPPLYLRAAEMITSKASYCDVGEAFRSELGIARESQ